MNKLFAVAAISAAAICGAAAAASLTGAGATFPELVYNRWAKDYAAKTGNTISYNGIGSGGGIKQIEAGTVDFGASDKPLAADELAKNGLAQFPTVIGGVVPVVNLPGVAPGQLKLTGPIVADIFRGVEKFWDDPVIVSYNRGLKLPHLPITVVHRSDGSGTTFLFTSYLSGNAAHWASGPGASTSVNWPVGEGGKGNEGVAVVVKQTTGSIGYVEYAYAKQNHMTYAVGSRRPPKPSRRRPRAPSGPRRPGSTCCCWTSRAPTPGRSAARPSSWCTASRPTPRPVTTCWRSLTGLTRTATRRPNRSITFRFRTG